MNEKNQHLPNRIINSISMQSGPSSRSLTINANEKIWNSDESYRTLVENVNMGVFRNTGERDGAFIYANPAMASLFGYDSVDEFLNAAVSNLYRNTEERRQFEAELLQNGFVKNRVLTVRKKDGSAITVSCTARIDREENGSVKWIDGLVEDITELKKTEKALLESEKKWRTLVQIIPDFILNVGRDGTIREINRPMLDSKPDDIAGTSIYGIINPRYHALLKNSIEEVLATGKSRSLEIHGNGPGGNNSTWYETRIIPLEGKNGREDSITLILTDMTGRRKITEALRASEKRMREITENMVDLVSISDLKGILQYVSPSHKISLGYDPEYLTGKFYGDFIHPGDLDDVLEAGRLGIKTRPVRVTEYQYRFRGSDGSYKWLETVAKIFRDENGKPAGMIFNSRDITDRIKLQEDLIRFVQALQSSSEAISMSSPNGRHFYQNLAFSGLFEYGMKELAALGGSTALFADTETAMAVREAVTAGISWAGEVEMISKSGKSIPVFLRADTIKDYTGKIIGLMWLHTDITERKTAEEKLRKTLEEIHNLSLTDELTGLYNRRGFLTLAEQQLKIADRMKDAILLLYADMDNMKLINDTLGHSVGDKALIETAKCFRETFRESDIIARIGGDEFVVLTIETSETGADVLVQRLQKIMGELNSRPGKSYSISLSIGIARYRSDSPCSIDDLIHRADKMMYEQKRLKQENKTL